MSTLSSTENKLLMVQARESLKGKWGLAIGVIIVFLLVMAVVQIIPVVGWIVSLLITGSMSVGIYSFSLSISRKQKANLSQIFSGFLKFGLALGAYLLQVIFVILWSLLLIVPGIIAAISYSMTYFIIIENNSIGPLEAITKSKEMMRGNKWKFFCLGCRFIGWALLCILYSNGIGLRKSDVEAQKIMLSFVLRFRKPKSFEYNTRYRFLMVVPIYSCQYSTIL